MCPVDWATAGNPSPEQPLGLRRDIWSSLGAWADDWSGRRGGQVLVGGLREDTPGDTAALKVWWKIDDWLVRPRPGDVLVVLFPGGSRSLCW